MQRSFRYVEENAVVNRFVQDFAKNIQNLSDEEKVAVISNYILDHVQYDDTLQNYTAYHAFAREGNFAMDMHNYFLRWQRHQILAFTMWRGRSFLVVSFMLGIR